MVVMWMWMPHGGGSVDVTMGWDGMEWHGSEDKD